MKQKNYLLFLLILNFSFINSNKEDEEDSRDFFGILFSIFQGLERKCFPELKKYMMNLKIMFQNLINHILGFLIQ